jgi:isocitrate dehydrogenase kinase/phosphatase
MFAKLLPYEAAYQILESYTQYYHTYKRITKRAPIRFEQRDWTGMQQDAAARNELYRDRITETVGKLKNLLGDQSTDPDLWRETKQYFAAEIENYNTRNIAETFYNSVFRHAHAAVDLGAAPDQMFVYASGTYREFRSTTPIYNRYNLNAGIEISLRQLLADYRLGAPYGDIERDLAHLRRRLSDYLQRTEIPGVPVRIEVLKSIFFRNQSAYLVGRICRLEKTTPFILALHNDHRGIYVDTLLLDYNDISTIFSYYRSYFLVDVDIVSDTVDFLRSILPTKSLGELYNSIGFEKHGKTVFYRDFQRHLDYAQDFYDFAPGTKGMVMSVFTLPSYNMVFKVIKDRFAPPKSTTQERVKACYDLVNRHDRVGRMADSYLFEHLAFDRKRFTTGLLEELERDCGDKVRIEGDTLTIAHLYIEKKMMPLNLYLQQAAPEDVDQALDEYGRAIKELASVNIFPGDLLQKNFGVTRLGRVVFYDYDEIGFLTDYRFRSIPEPQYPWQEMAAEPWYTVAENDIFPEEFPRFLFRQPAHRRRFEELHGDLFTAAYWTDLQERIRSGQRIEILPYREELRFQRNT